MTGFVSIRVTVDRGRITKQISMFPGVRIPIQTKMFSVFCEMSLTTAAVLGLSAACSMDLVRQHASSTGPRYYEAARRQGTQCRSCRYIAYVDWCQQVLLRRMSKKRLVNIKHSLYWILSATGNQCNSWTTGVTRSRGLRSRTVRVAGSLRAGLAETVPVLSWKDQPARRYSSPVISYQKVLA